MRGSDGLKVVINGIRLGLLPSLVCRASLPGGGDVGCALYLFSDKVAVVTSFEEVCTAEPRFNESLFNENLDITNGILCPSNSKMYEKEHRYNEPSI